jgi:hypothetical protein
MRAGGLGDSMRLVLAEGNGLGDSLRSGLGSGSGSGRGGSILSALGRWTKHITTLPGHGDGGLTGLSDAVSTPRNLENVLQQKGEVYMNKEAEGEKAARTSGGGEWADLVGGMHGYNRVGVNGW